MVLEGAVLVDLSSVASSTLAQVGGKALGLGRLIGAGERVPEGFCLTTRAYRAGHVPRDEVLAAYRRLGGGRVAVRSSATAEDLPDASFAGQQDTYLDVEGDDALVGAIERCWASLHSERATAYREAHDWQGEAEIAVVVQRMVHPRAAGVLFTANPVTGTRTETVIDATAGLGDVVVDGSSDAVDHHVLADDAPAEGSGCLTTADLDLLRATGRRIEKAAGSPQDIEWAIDDDGLWLLQSRAITTLFPVPGDTDGLRVYLEAGHMQGLAGPMTPLGMSVMQQISADYFALIGMPGMSDVVVDIAGRLFLDLTPFLRNARMRTRVADGMELYGPGVKRRVAALLDDPRFAPTSEKVFDVGAAVRAMVPLMPGAIIGTARAVLFPAATRRRVFAAREAVRNRAPMAEDASAAERLGRLTEYLWPVFTGPMTETLAPLYVGLGSNAVAEKLLDGVIEPGEADEISRGMPYNVTTHMDLELWQVAQRAAGDRGLFGGTDPAELARMYRAGELPDIGLDRFLADYGQRAAMEIDLGMPRWAEDPTPVFAAIAGYLQVTDPAAAPDVRYEAAAREAEETLERVTGRAGPVRGAVARFLFRRHRQLAGLREMPKYLWVVPLLEMRRQALLAGQELADRGLLTRPDDIVYLTLPEAEAAAAGTDQRELAARRRATHERENRRAYVPGLLLSDGTMLDALPDPDAPAEDAHHLTGLGAAAGTATGTVRVVHDPATARMEPGDILVATTTDPGWTPLFLTAAGLITEKGSPVAHGPTVAREYGIPAVICVPGATTRLTTGQRVTVDGASGTITIED